MFSYHTWKNSECDLPYPNGDGGTYYDKRAGYSGGLNLHVILWGCLRNLSYETQVLFGSLSGMFYERKGEQSLAVSWNIPSFLPLPQALCCCISCCVLLTEEMLIHGSELQETLFPGEETSLAELPAPSSANFCHRPFSQACTGLTDKGQSQFVLKQWSHFPLPVRLAPCLSRPFSSDPRIPFQFSSLTPSSHAELWPHMTTPGALLCKHHVFSSLSALAQDVPCLEWPRPSVGSLKSYPCFYPAQWWPAMWHLLAFFVFVFILLSRIFSNMQVSGQSCVVTLCVPISQLQQWPDFF